jgi:hypothetical protein
MMKLIHSFIHSLFPHAKPTPRPALSVVEPVRTCEDLSAKGFPLGTLHRAGLNARFAIDLKTAMPGGGVSWAPQRRRGRCLHHLPRLTIIKTEL